MNPRGVGEPATSLTVAVCRMTARFDSYYRVVQNLGRNELDKRKLVDRLAAELMDNLDTLIKAWASGDGDDLSLQWPVGLEVIELSGEKRLKRSPYHDKGFPLRRRDRR